MSREKTLEGILSSGVMAVIRADTREECIKLAEAAIKGGIESIEITMTVPGALDIISGLSKQYSDSNNVLIGAGTVLDSETARLCIISGACFIVSPALNINTIKLCNRYAVAVIPGIMTLTEAVTAMEYGCSVLKLFPGSAYKPSIIDAFNGPLPQARFIPTGGVGPNNAEEWIRAGAAAIGVGGELTKCGGDYSLVTRNAELLLKAVAKARTN